MSSEVRHTIHVTENGPYRFDGGLGLRDRHGNTIDAPDRVFLCRCGQSDNKPFCDGSHARVGFDGTETADRGPIAARQEHYAGHGATIHDDRSVCSHAGFCTDNLAAVFKLDQEPWIDANGADAAVIVEQVKRCPSGALSVTVGDDPSPVEDDRASCVHPTPDGPYRVTGGVEVVGADGTPYEVRNRQTLCRCGGSSNKPFCDGTHWHIGFQAS